MTSLSGLIKGILLAVLTTLMLFLVALALISLARLDRGSDNTTDTMEALPAGPLTSVPLGQEGEGSVVCFRPGDGDQSFLVELISPGSGSENFVIGIDLLGPDGARSSRLVTFPQAEPGVAVQAAVPDSAATDVFFECTVTGIQRDRQVTLTGQ